VVKAREAARDEEQRHDLHDPADRAEPGLSLERVLAAPVRRRPC
jgi:hypothetical protein